MLLRKLRSKHVGIMREPHPNPQPRLPPFCVQYAARLNAEKLKSFIHKMNAGKIGKK